jgi:carboxymethylenebutenolidase
MDVAERFAARGYAAFAPDLFSAGRRVACLARAMVESSRGGSGKTTAAIEASRAWLADRPDVDQSRLAVIGFCMGGGFALTYAASSPAGVRAASVNYGDVPRKADVLEGVCPVVGSYGARDRILGPQGQRLEEYLRGLGIAHDVKTYPQAGHSFMTHGSHPIGRLIFLPMRLGYVHDAAEDAWDRVFAFFQEHV